MEFLSAFEVPACAIPVVDRFVAPEEALLIEALDAPLFSSDDARAALQRRTCESWSATRVDALLRAAYRRGVVTLEDESFTNWRIADFYLALEVLAVSDPGTYLKLPPSTRDELDRWCFQKYVAGLGDDVRPTADRVLPLDETLAFIDSNDLPIWLNRCDCRTLSGRCDKPVEVCVSFRNGINTLGHRGVSKAITGEEAKAVVRKADAAGLMHTVNEQGICNCCSDCCYLFRAQRTRGAEVATWPLAEYVASLKRELCIDCGLCSERCPFGALAFDGDSIAEKFELCRGCGLCVETCLTSALSLVPRMTVEIPAK